MQPTLVILAAGMGSRYGGLKQLDGVGPDGSRLLDYALYDAKRAGFGRAVAVIRRDFADAFQEQVIERLEGQFPVEVVFQDGDDLPGDFVVPEGRTKPWGTGHATLAARSVVKEPFAVINADDFYGPEAYALLATGLAEGTDGVLVAYPLGATLSPHGSVSRGVCAVDGDRWLQSIEEVTQIRWGDDGALSSTELTEDTLVSMNCLGLPTAAMSLLEERFERFLREGGATSETAEYYLPVALAEAVAEGELRLRVVTAPGPWLGVTYAGDSESVMAALADLHRAGLYPDRLWA